MKRSITAGLLLITLGAACRNDAPVTLKSPSLTEGRRVRITINPGEGWIHAVPYDAAPQFAVWTEGMDGRYSDTIFVTAKTARQGWLFAMETRKPGALPVWSHRRGVTYRDGLSMPVKDKPLPDAVTAATPRAQCTIECLLPPSQGARRVYFEFNHSADWNATYREDLPPDHRLRSLDVGQPSVVYAADIDPETPGVTVAALVGHGSVSGETGDIEADVGDLTTALQIVSSIVIEVE
jgi:hypothetical protein